MKRKIALGVMRALFLIGIMTLTLNIQPATMQSGTIYIRADGSIDPQTAPIHQSGDLYTFTGNISDSIVVYRSSIVIDGGGYTVNGTGTSYSKGIYLDSTYNVTIKNTNIKNFDSGIFINLGSRNVIHQNNIANNQFGIEVVASSKNVIRQNSLANNEYGIYVWDISSNNEIYGNDISYNTVWGIFLHLGSSNQIFENSITNNRAGIRVYGYSSGETSNNLISENNITANGFIGIEMEGTGSNNNIIHNNNIVNSGQGIRLSGSVDNTIYENDIANNTEAGVRLWATGATPKSSSNNTFYHNNFLNNTPQVDAVFSLENAWDDGYPSGGNYWKDYAGVDVNGDGIGDTPFIVDENNTDRYPLMNPWMPSEHEPISAVQVGVKAGHWIKIDYTISGAPSGSPLPQWLKVEFLSVEETSTTARVTMHMSDGTEQSETVPVDIVGGGQALGLSGFVIPANCTTGDSIYMSGYGDITIEGETTRTYAGASRTVVYASFSQLGIQLTYYWDKQTGIMVEATTISGSITATGKATETNMWEAVISPFWMQWWFYAIVAAIIVALAGTVYFLKKRKPPTPNATPLPTEST